MAKSVLKEKQTDLTIIVDGNDGVGKTTLVKSLKSKGFVAKDRGVPTLLTDDKKVRIPKNEIYIILDAPVSVCRCRLKKAQKGLNEKYHTVADLSYYRKKFLKVAQTLPNCAVIPASGSANEVLFLALKVIKRFNN